MIGEFLKDDANRFRHFHKESVGSTNTELVDLAFKGDPGNLWLTAGEQLSGKGSRGRDWVSVNGNLYASLLLVDPAPRNHLHELTFVAATAARNTLAIASEQRQKIQVKWPNDLMCNGKKIGGILLEAGEANKSSYVVIGFGINVGIYPPNTRHSATSLLEENVRVLPHELFQILSVEMAKLLHQWSKGVGFNSILNLWTEHAFGIGETATVALPQQGELKGLFQGIDDSGRMVLAMENENPVRISSADIFFSTMMDKDT